MSRRSDESTGAEAGAAPHEEAAAPARPFVSEDAAADALRAEVERESSRLTQRPTIRIRTRMTLSFLCVFALCAGITVWIMYALSRIQDKIRFLEVADSYVSEVQQARRFEKNFLLYGTNLEDAQEHLHNAQRLLDVNRAMVRKVLGARNLDTLSRHVADYRRLLNDISETRDDGDRAVMEAELRLHGSQMIAFAMDFARRERQSVDRAFKLARRVPFVFLAVLLLTMLVIAMFLTRQFLGGLARFMEYTKRIGEGNFTPITPVRRYRDEFSQLALAFNKMICELDRRHRILVESHKVRAIGSLVAGVAHELNNPLNNIMLTASLLLEEIHELNEDQKVEMLQDVIGETERSQRIVRNLLDFARKSEADVQRLDLEQLVQDSVRLVANQVRLAKIKLETDCESDLPHVHGDEQMLKQVFVNLILNAVDVLRPGGRIQVSVRKGPDESYVNVEVRDDGPGIPEHVRQRVFDPFFTTKKEGKGTGLGLSVSQGIVRKLGGFIRVETKEGEGSAFIVSLPVTASPADLMSRGDAEDDLGPLPTGLKRTAW